MEYGLLKNTGIKVSRLCMGGCPMGQYGWGDVSENELVDAVRTALDNGLTFYDTADTYGLGKSEETLGKALGSERKQVVIATKFGVRVENGHTFYDNSPAYIFKAVDASLRRLHTDYIDLYLIHYRDGKTRIDRVVETLEILKRQGKIRSYGLSNIQQRDADELKSYAGNFCCLQDEYSLAYRQNENDLVALSKQLSLTPMTWGSLGQGILTGKYGADVSFEKSDRRSREIYANFHGERLLKNLRIVEAMRPIATAHGVSVAAVAVRFILDRMNDSVVLVGAKRPAQICGSLEAMDWSLTDREMSALINISG